MRTLLLLSLLMIGAAAQAEDAPPNDSRALFAFTYAPGPAWQQGKPMGQQDLRAHARYHADLVKTGASYAAGGFVGEEGGMALIRAASLDQARTILAADPAIQNRVFTATIREWQPRFVSGDSLEAPGATMQEGNR